MLIFGILPINNVVSVTLSLSLSHPAFCLQMSCICILDTWMALSHYFSTAVFLYSASCILPSFLCEILLLWPPTFSFVLTFVLAAATHSVWIKHCHFCNLNYVTKYYSTSVFLCVLQWDVMKQNSALIWIHIAQLYKHHVWGVPGAVECMNYSMLVDTSLGENYEQCYAVLQK